MRPLLERLHRDDAARRRGGLPQGRGPDPDGRRHLPGCTGDRGRRRLGCADLRPAAGDRTDRRLYSYERRDDFAAIARRNVDELLRRAAHPAWELRVGDLVETPRIERSRSTGRCSTCSLPGSASTRSPRAGARRRDLLLRRHHHPAGPDGGDPAGARRLHRAGGRPSRWSGPGTSKGWPCGPGTAWSATPASWSPPGGWPPAWRRPPASVVRHPARMARITPGRVDPSPSAGRVSHRRCAMTGTPQEPTGIGHRSAGAIARRCSLRSARSATSSTGCASGSRPTRTTWPCWSAGWPTPGRCPDHRGQQRAARRDAARGPRPDRLPEGRGGPAGPAAGELRRLPRRAPRTTPPTSSPPAARCGSASAPTSTSRRSRRAAR